MKKLLSIILIACLAMAVMAIAPVSAANDQVLRGTPTVDGKVDDIYRGSLTIVYDGDNAKNAASHGWMDATGKFYALYDDQFLYLCGEVKDNDVVSAGDGFVYENVNPYGNDCVEFRLDLGGGQPAAMDNFFKIGIDAYGKRIYSPMGISCDLDAVQYATSITADGYIVELAVPYGQRANDDLVASGELGLKIWLFDLIGDYAGEEAPVDGVHFLHYCMSYKGEGSGDRVFYEVSNKKAQAVAASDDTTAKQEDTTAKQEDTTAKQEDTTAKQEDTTAPVEDTTPSTFDPIVIAAVVTAASGAAFVVASKKRK